MPTKPPAESQPHRLQVSTVPLDSLHEDPANARLHDERNLRAITASLKQFGQVEPLISQASTGKVIGGNGRLQAMRALGWQHAKVNVLDIDDVQATALGLALNRTAELAEWDQDALVRLGESLKDSDIDLQAMALDADSLLRNMSEESQSDKQDNDTGEACALDDMDFSPNKNDALAVSEVCQGKTSHAMVGGDCFGMMRNLQDASVNLWFCDLPYGVTNNHWDTEIDLSALKDMMKKKSNERFVAVFTAIQPFSHGIMNVFLDTFKYDLVWDKGASSSFFNANQRPLPLHEHLLIFANKSVYNPQKTKRDKLRKATAVKGTDPTSGIKRKHVKDVYDDKYPTSILRYSIREGRWAGRTHPTQKPLDLLLWIVRTYSMPGDIVVDPTAGSGTTGVAAAVTGRRFIGCEMNKSYLEGCVSRIGNAYKTGIDPNAEAGDASDGPAASEVLPPPHPA